MRYAVADTGSNTIRLGIYDYENGHLKQILNKAVFANLAGFIQNGFLSSDGIRAAENAITLHAQTAAKYGCSLNVFATAAIRNAKNTEEICSEIKLRTGTEIHVLSGEEEAELSFWGALCDFPCDDGVMADVGGGSSEIIIFSNRKPVSSLSVPWGSLKAYKTYVYGELPNKAEIVAIQSAVTQAISKHLSFKNVTKKNLCIVGGGVRASQLLANALLKTTELTVEGVNRMLNIITDNPSAAKAAIEEHAPERMQTIAPAIAIYSAVGTHFDSEQIFVSDRGIKEGYVLNVLAKSRK